jgi:hypothetical protein
VGHVAISQGRLDDAELALDETLALALDIGYEAMVADALHLLGRVALGRGDRDKARRLLTDALGRAERIGDVEVRDGSLAALAGIDRG